MAESDKFYEADLSKAHRKKSASISPEKLNMSKIDELMEQEEQSNNSPIRSTFVQHWDSTNKDRQSRSMNNYGLMFCTYLENQSNQAQEESLNDSALQSCEQSQSSEESSSESESESSAESQLLNRSQVNEVLANNRLNFLTKHI